MKLHSDTLTSSEIYAALSEAKRRGGVAEEIDFDRFDTVGSRTKRHAYELHLGTDVKLPGSKRRKPNPGTNSDATADLDAWAARWDEWGHFLSVLFEADPDAVVGYYKGAGDFHAITREQFIY